MLEVLFSDSAAGSLKVARGHSGEGLFGRICSLHLCLSVGPLADDAFGPERKRTLSELYGVFPHGREVAETFLRLAQEGFRTIAECAQKGEDVRIWYSDEPDERCGLCWLLAQMADLSQRGRIQLVKLPAWELVEVGAMVRRSSWAEMVPERWADHLSLQQVASDALCAAMAAEWYDLRRDDASLRAVINGRLRSVPADFYDHFILREIADLPEEFQQAVAIGRVLGAYQLGISDGFIAQRMQEMIDKGLLEPVTQPKEGEPAYYRILRKT